MPIGTSGCTGPLAAVPASQPLFRLHVPSLAIHQGPGQIAPAPSHVSRIGGGGWHEAWVDSRLMLAAPIGLSPLSLVLSLNPSSLLPAEPTSLSPPSALGAPVLPILTSLLPFPWYIVATEPPGGPCFTARRATALAIGQVPKGGAGVETQGFAHQRYRQVFFWCQILFFPLRSFRWAPSPMGIPLEPPPKIFMSTKLARPPPPQTVNTTQQK